MSLATTISAMVAAGCTPEQLEAVVLAHEADEAARLSSKRAKDAERQRKSRMSRSVTVTARDSHGHGVTASREIENAPTHAEPEPNKTTSSPVQKDILTDIPKVPVAKPKSADAMCVAELGKVLDPEHARAVVEHRNRMRKPMTAHAAGLLAKRLSSAPDPNAAADEMIERGWQGWRPEWGQNSQAPPHRQARRNTALDELNDIADRMFGNVQQFPRIAG